MSAFLSTLIVEDPDGFPYIVHEPLVYRSDLLKRDVVIPVGFKTDLASIPRLAQLLLPKSGKYDRAAVVHDFLYVTNGVSRETADAVLLEAMEVLKVNKKRRQLIYRAVRVGGWWAWGKYRRADQKAGQSHAPTA